MLNDSYQKLFDNIFGITVTIGQHATMPQCHIHFHIYGHENVLIFQHNILYSHSIVLGILCVVIENNRAMDKNVSQISPKQNEFVCVVGAWK